MLPASRKQALATGSSYYFNGKSCKNGHTAKRHTHNSVCDECARISGKKWYAKNSSDIEWRKRWLFKSVKNRALLKGIPFDLEFNNIEWPDVCPVFKTKLNYTSSNSTDHNSASFDKVDPAKGYTKGNVRIISHRANWLKQDSTIEQLEQIISYMKEHNEHIST